MPRGSRSKFERIVSILHLLNEFGEMTKTQITSMAQILYKQRNAIVESLVVNGYIETVGPETRTFGHKVTRYVITSKGRRLLSMMNKIYDALELERVWE